MKLTRSLPNSYVHYIDVRPNKYRKAHTIALIIALPITLGVFLFFIELAYLLRVDYSKSSSLNPASKLWVIIGLLVVPIIVIAVHECMHGLLIWIFTHEFPNLHIQILGVSVEAPDWYIPRNKLILIGLAPLILLTLIGISLLFVVPPEIIGTVAIGLTINIVGSYVDIAVAMYANLLPKSSLINLSHGQISIFNMETKDLHDKVPKWKRRLRHVIEQEILPRLV